MKNIEPKTFVTPQILTRRKKEVVLTLGYKTVYRYATANKKAPIAKTKKVAFATFLKVISCG